MPEEDQKIGARGRLAAAEVDLERLHEELVQLARDQASDGDLEFKPAAARAYDAALKRTKAELAMAEYRRAACLADVRAEEAERENARLIESNRKALLAAEEAAAASVKAAAATRDQVRVTWVAIAISIAALLFSLFKG